MPYQPIIAASIPDACGRSQARWSVVSRAKRIEGRFAAFAKLLLHRLTLILCIGTWPGPSIITWPALVPGDLGQFAERLKLRELRAVVGVGDRAWGRRPSPSENS